ncbi:hypothetical protein [Salinivibrio sp. KP-1]|uniref:hypothetical protein n=1 Tax=Salinivibrio sp. KP-1 TaxID=1406902 RepID=UPI0006144E8D|nr:hypothetical protein [Salinivibrio sp. KP-1]KKA43753.1 hypothetical protein WN56_15620 [Salinivibrio sp. KP-1]
MDNQRQLINELEEETKTLSTAPMVGAKVAAPLRLLIVWMRGIVDELQRIKERLDDLEARQ